MGAIINSQGRTLKKVVDKPDSESDSRPDAESDDESQKEGILFFGKCHQTVVFYTRQTKKHLLAKLLSLDWSRQDGFYLQQE